MPDTEVVTPNGNNTEGERRRHTNREKLPLTYTLSDAGFALPQPAPQKKPRRGNKRRGKGRPPSSQEKSMDPNTDVRPTDGAPIQEGPAPTSSPERYPQSEGAMFTKDNAKRAGWYLADKAVLSAVLFGTIALAKKLLHLG